MRRQQNVVMRRLSWKEFCWLSQLSPARRNEATKEGRRIASTAVSQCWQLQQLSRQALASAVWVELVAAVSLGGLAASHLAGAAKSWTWNEVCQQGGEEEEEEGVGDCELDARLLCYNRQLKVLLVRTTTLSDIYTLGERQKDAIRSAIKTS